MSFDAEKVKGDLVKWIKEWFDKNGADCNAIVGISGGKDSSVVAALCKEALGKDRVIGVLMPQNVQSDINYSKELVEFLGIKHYVVNIGKTVDTLTDEIEKAGDFDIARQTKVNLPARIRMSTLYAVAQSLNGRVANTCNLSEDWVGYATRYGDGAGDFSPLSDLTVNEVLQIGRQLGLPEHIVSKTPLDGLSGKTDEENLGFSYDVLDKYIRTGKIDDIKVKEKIDELNVRNKFKLELIPKFEYKPE